VFVLAVAAGLAAAGCSGGSRIAAENDRLRSENADLLSKLGDLEGRHQEFAAQLKVAAASQPQSTVDPEVRANTPVIGSVKLGKLSHAVDDDRDGTPEKLRLYLESADGRGRFTQVVGTVAVTAALLPTDGEAVTIGQGRFTPTEVRDAYRSGMTGTHYTFEIPVQVELPPPEAGKPVPTATVRVEFTDGLTGQTLTAERSIALR